MRKDKLIALLESIEGNPDILFYNGYVEDWADIIVHQDKHTLYKPCKKHYKMMLSLENQARNTGITEEALDALVKQYSPDWELPNNYYDKDDIKTRYSSKKDVVFIESKERGKKYFSRDMRVDY